MSDSTFYKRHCIYLPAMAGWFICSSALSSYNKIIFGKDHLAFPCPLLLTSVHFFVQWVFSYSVSELYPDYFGGKVLTDMSWRVYLGVSVPCGLVTAFDVGLSNLSLVRISITFFTMIKSSAPIWVLISAYMFGLVKITFNLLAVGLLITAGEVLTAFGEVEFDAVGFLLVLGAAICGGIRWTLVQLKLQTLDPPLVGPVVTMRLLASTMFCSMLLLSFIIERPWNVLGPENGDYFSDFEHSMKTVSLGLVGAFIAIVMVLCEFWLILKSDAITLMIGGVVKEMITICVGVIFFGDNLNTINASGIVVVFLGVLLYKVTLHLSNSEKDNQSSGIEDSAQFSRVSSNDIFGSNDNPARLGKRSLGGRNRKLSDPDIALSFKIDDDDINDFMIDDDSDVDEEVLNRIDPLSPLRERINGASLELDPREVEYPAISII